MSERELRYRPVGGIFLAHQQQQNDLFIRIPSSIVEPNAGALDINLRGRIQSLLFGMQREHQQIRSIGSGHIGYVQQPPDISFSFRTNDTEVREKLIRLASRGVMFDFIIASTTLLGCVIQNTMDILELGETQALQVNGICLRMVIGDNPEPIREVPQSVTVKMNEIGEIEFDIPL